MAKTMAVNAGSSSLKFQLLEMPAEQVIAQGVIERIGMDDAIVTIKYGAEIVAERLVGHSDDDEDHITITKDGKGKKYENVVPIKNHQQAINFMLQKLTDLGIIEDFQKLQALVIVLLPVVSGLTILLLLRMRYWPRLIV